MTTAREAARKAAQKSALNDETDAMYGADASSDVWEPIVLKLMDMLVAAGVRPELLDEIIGDTLTE